MNKEKLKKKKGYSFLKKYLTKEVIIIILGMILVGVIGLSIGSHFFSSSKTTKLGFEDIGELATQSAYCSTVSDPQKSRTLFGMEIPFTQSKYVYSYDTIIKAGIDFTQVKWSINETDKKITVKIPKVKILSSQIDYSSMKIYHEDESVFTPFSLSENNEALKELKKAAEKDAISNGLLDNAESNAKQILTSFFGNVYSLEEYKIEFKRID